MISRANAQALSQDAAFTAAAQEQYTAILARSATDSAFRSKLLTNPRAAVEEFSGRAVPASFNIRFIENAADATVVLPDPIDPRAELSESELETVAGGVTPTILLASLAWSAVASLSAYIIGHETA
ncbi:MAG: NHLP leader peptide family RiPP precursor [Gemmatimonadaceae bacterium]|nr:NHLP leader peptide family RiPP precursor [Gemmatimonadaceae bacterium]